MEIVYVASIVYALIGSPLEEPLVIKTVHGRQSLVCKNNDYVCINQQHYYAFLECMKSVKDTISEIKNIGVIYTIGTCKLKEGSGINFKE